MFHVNMESDDQYKDFDNRCNVLSSSSACERSGRRISLQDSKCEFITFRVLMREHEAQFRYILKNRKKRGMHFKN